ncbi:hypothetical protein [Lactococcus lactis]|uniref:hypothetical protein n=1 Tax=Lactococcus lactis TaxID=1358 RepID=UPI0010132461|nr:hypothetical protein [Lactococcus lactis]RXS50238.1 hypothetical protein ES032_12810 [Lactococcus lactis]
MVVKARRKGTYSCLLVTADTKVREVDDFLRSIGEERQLLLNFPLPYWLVHEEGRGGSIFRLSDKQFKREYEVME